MPRDSCVTVSTILLALLLCSAVDINAKRESMIASSFRQRSEPSGVAPASYQTAALLESLYDSLGPDLCFTERGRLSLIQLCLEHGFRRLEVERTSHFYEEIQQGGGTEEEEEERAINGNPTVSPHLMQELERLFDAAASAPLDGVFFQGTPQSKRDRRFGSPFRADLPRRDPSALANITSEVYGRFDPSMSRLKLDRERGEATMLFPNGDMCYNHVEHREIPWSTHFRMMCSLSDVGSALSTGASWTSSSTAAPPIKWDVRVNAQLCTVIVLVFSEKVC